MSHTSRSRTFEVGLAEQEVLTAYHRLLDRGFSFPGIGVIAREVGCAWETAGQAADRLAGLGLLPPRYDRHDRRRYDCKSIERRIAKVRAIKAAKRKAGEDERLSPKELRVVLPLRR